MERRGTRVELWPPGAAENGEILAVAIKTLAWPIQGGAVGTVS
jgi:hypothetical protein